MPILAEETSLSPNNLLDEDYFPATEERRWHVIYTRSRHEKSLARHLLANNISFYLPLIPKEHVVRGRRRNSFLPLFTGYVFLHDEFPRALMHSTSYCISRILPVDNQDQLVTDLRNIRGLIDAGAPLSIEQRLQAGQRVRVKTGALKGIEGTIIRRNHGTRLFVAVNYLQQGVSMEIDDFMVEPI